jgi:hypothetical protein
MPPHALRRLLFAWLALAGAVLACARAEVPIDTDQRIATAVNRPATATAPAVALASATNLLAEATQPADAATATRVPSTTPELVENTPTATSEFDFAIIPIANGTFDNDLSSWNVTPNWTAWADGYARANAGQAGPGAVLVQFTNVPRGREVKLHFSARSEDALAGECEIESRRDTVHSIPADGEWHAVEVDYTLDAGTQTAVSLQALNNDHCDWLNFDEVYWLVAGGVASNPATATAEGPTPEGTAPEADASSTEAATAIPTLAAIPDEAEFTQDFTVSPSGDTAIGVPADLTDDQTLTWASLRSGTGAWVFDLGRAASVAGLRLIAHRDGNQDTTILGIDVSTDGQDWTEVYAASGECDGTADCEVIEQGTPVDLPFGPVEAEYVRVRSGPTRFALAEVEVAVVEE